MIIFLNDDQAYLSWVRFAALCTLDAYGNSSDGELQAEIDRLGNPAAWQ